jgi:hypothetical protein
MNTEQRAEGEGRRGQSPELVKRMGVRERVARALKGRERCAREDAEEAERLKAERAEAERMNAERLKAEELKAEADIKAAKHAVWLKCQIALCAEVGAPGNPRARDLERWIGRMAGVNAMGYACLQDIKEMIRGLHLDQARAMLRLALATNVVALYERDEEVVVAQAKVEVESGQAEKGDSPPEQRVEPAAVQSPFSARKE